MVKEESIHEETRILLKKARDEGVTNVFDRRGVQDSGCKFCVQGISCQICSMGPCRIIDGRREKGVCGADRHLMVARNLGRMIAAGAAAHSDHGRDLVELAHTIANGHTDVYTISSPEKLKALVNEMAGLDASFADYAKTIDWNNTDMKSVLDMVASRFIDEYGMRKGNLDLINRAPNVRLEIWDKVGVTPRGIDREIVEMMHRGHMGVESIPTEILAHAARVSLSDGWGGSMIATDLSDVIFGVPEPKLSSVNLGNLKEDYVNVAVHGHNPIVSEQIIKASRDPEMIEQAKSIGAKGINIVGICCTGNELVMRQGVPMAGNLLSSELAIVTGVLDAMVVDYQCIFPALNEVANCYQTELISTNEKAHYPGATHIQFEYDNADVKAREVLKKGFEAFTGRNEAGIVANIPSEPVDMMTGFSNEAIISALGGSLEPLLDVIKSGHIKGVVGVVGCNNPRVNQDYLHTGLIQECIERDMLVLVTGCSTVAAGKAGLMVPEGASQAGEGLKTVCNQLGIPPVLHVGSCVDNSRILELCGLIAKELGVDISDLPVAASAPEWMSEKALSIGLYAVASGIETILSIDTYFTGSDQVVKFLTEDLEDIFGASFRFANDPKAMADIIEHRINNKRQSLGLDLAPMAAD